MHNSKPIIAVLIYFVFQAFLFAQITVENNKLKVEFKSEEVEFFLNQENNLKIIDYYLFSDPSNPGSFKLPGKRLVFAIPPESNPSLMLTNKSFSIISNAIPATNPKIQKLNDSTLVYEELEFKPDKNKYEKREIIQLGEKFWYRDFYCIEVIINTHHFDYSDNSIVFYNKISFELVFDKKLNINEKSPIILKSEFDKNIKKLLFNSGIAEQFRKKKPVQSSKRIDSWINYSQNYIKIAVSDDALYKIDKVLLSNYNVPVNSINPLTFQLFESGVEIPVFVEGEQDGVFDDQDYISFWGTKNYSDRNHHLINARNEPYNTYLDIYTDTSYYFLTWGSKNGLRYSTGGGNSGSSGEILNYHNKLMHFEENSWYQNFNTNEIANQTSDWNNNKTWYWNWIFENTISHNINLPNIYPGIPGKIFFKLTSAGSSVLTNSHQLTLKFNNAKVDTLNLNRFSQALLQGTVQNFDETNNVLSVTNHSNGTFPNFLAYDWFEIEYPKHNVLENDKLVLKVPDNFTEKLTTINISGATSESFYIYKINGGYKKIENYTFESGSISFTDTVDAGDEYAIFAETEIQIPEVKFSGQFVNLKSNNTQADYIAISADIFYARVSNYLNNIENFYGLSTRNINVEDIFNQFGFGYPTPESIKAFVKYAYDNWNSPKPSYLVLFGDGSYDYKDYVLKNFGVKLSQNHIPPFGIPVSDNWYAIWDDGPGLPQLKVGRIPMLSESDLDRYESKIINNFNADYDSWNKRYLLFSGGVGSNPNELKLLKSANDSLLTKYIEPRPVSGNYHHFYKTNNPVSDFGPFSQDEVNNAIGNSGVFISYVGHSGTSTWDNSINDVSQLKSSVNRNPIITDFGCSTNKYAEPDIISFGEKFLFDEEGEALNYIGNSSLGFTYTAVPAPKFFFESFLSDSLKEVGNAHLNAKFRLYEIFGGTNVFDVFSLSNVILGDPAVRIKIPDKPNLTFDESPVYFSSDLNEIDDSATVSVVISNYGSAAFQYYLFTVEHYFDNTLFESQNYRLALPGNSDTTNFKINTKNLAGKHRLVLKLDVENSIAELNEEDNVYTYDFQIYSSAVKDLSFYQHANGNINTLKILNPIINETDNFSILAEFSANEEFDNPIEVVTTGGKLATEINVPQINSERIWFRYKVNNPDYEFSAPKSFVPNNNFQFYLSDKYSFDKQNLDGVEFTNTQLKLSNEKTEISVLSAGWYAGANCVIAKNGENLLDNSVFAGMGIVVFDSLTLDVENSAWYSLYDNQPNAEALANLINEIPDGKIVVMGVSDDGQHRLIPELKDAIKSIGSTKIDSLEFRGSWSIIGRKGANEGDTDVIEKIRGPYDGSAFLNKEYILPRRKGYLLTEQLGPSNGWDSLYVNYIIPEGGSINITPIGIRNNGIYDTLNTSGLASNYISLANIGQSIYPYLKLKLDFQLNDNAESPVISELGVIHEGASELALNSQTVKLLSDSVIVGQPLKMDFNIGNAGYFNAGNVDFKIDLYKESGFVKTIYDSTFTEIKTNSFMNESFEYHTVSEDGIGKFKLLFVVDPQNTVAEFFEDNNVFEMPFRVIRDTTTGISNAKVLAHFDGREIYNGDFVNRNPKIDIHIDYNGSFNLNDSNSVLVKINQKQVPFSDFKINNNIAGNRITLSYLPILNNGKNTFSVSGDGLMGEDGRNGVFREFTVSTDAKILFPYNYPNPVNNNTFFTFQLSNIPELLNIKIYTISGRLIREMEIPEADLNLNFNKIFWDAKDQDGDLISNGVYLYKIISKRGDEKFEIINKLAVAR